MAQAMQKALNDDDTSIKVLFSTLKSNQPVKALFCPPGNMGATENTDMFPERTANAAPCEIEGYTVICTKGITDPNNGLPQPDQDNNPKGAGDGPDLADFCTDANKLMFNPGGNARNFDHTRNAGSRGQSRFWYLGKGRII
jgi:hypothetical protein